MSATDRIVSVLELGKIPLGQFIYKQDRVHDGNFEKNP